MPSILEQVNNTKAEINNQYTAEQQVELAIKYKDMLLNNIAECKEYLKNTNYKPSMSFEYSLDTMKSIVEDSTAEDLYTSIETMLDVINSYDSPFSCRSGFDFTESAMEYFFRELYISTLGDVSETTEL